MAPDETIPADPWTGKQVCRTCQAIGEPGDARHPETAEVPPAPPPDVARQRAEWDAAILGESSDP